MVSTSTETAQKKSPSNMENYYYQENFLHHKVQSYLYYHNQSLQTFGGKK